VAKPVIREFHRSKRKKHSDWVFTYPEQTGLRKTDKCGSEVFDIVATEDFTRRSSLHLHCNHRSCANVASRSTLTRANIFCTKQQYDWGASLAGSHVVSDKPVRSPSGMTRYYGRDGWNNWPDNTGQPAWCKLLLWSRDLQIMLLRTMIWRVYILATRTILTSGWTECRSDCQPVGWHNMIIPSHRRIYGGYQRVTSCLCISNLSGQPVKRGHHSSHNSCTGSRQIGFTRSTNNAFWDAHPYTQWHQDTFIWMEAIPIITGSEFTVVPEIRTGNAWVYYRMITFLLRRPCGSNLMQIQKENSTSGFCTCWERAEYGYFSDSAALHWELINHSAQETVSFLTAVQTGKTLWMEKRQFRNMGSRWPRTAISLLKTQAILPAWQWWYCELRDTIHIVFIRGKCQSRSWHHYLPGSKPDAWSRIICKYLWQKLRNREIHDRRNPGNILGEGYQ